jgi:hypothetical protein
MANRGQWKSKPFKTAEVLLSDEDFCGGITEYFIGANNQESVLHNNRNKGHY